MTETFQADTSFQRIETRSSMPLLLRATLQKLHLTKRILSPSASLGTFGVDEGIRAFGTAEEQRDGILVPKVPGSKTVRPRSVA